MTDRLLKVSEVAQIFQVTPYTVREWIREKKLDAIALPSGHYRVTESAVEDLAKRKYHL